MSFLSYQTASLRVIFACHGPFDDTCQWWCHCYFFMFYPMVENCLAAEVSSSLCISDALMCIIWDKTSTNLYIVATGLFCFEAWWLVCAYFIILIQWLFYQWLHKNYMIKTQGGLLIQTSVYWQVSPMDSMNIWYIVSILRQGHKGVTC